MRLSKLPKPAASSTKQAAIDDGKVPRQAVSLSLLRYTTTLGGWSLHGPSKSLNHTVVASSRTSSFLLPASFPSSGVSRGLREERSVGTYSKQMLLDDRSALPSFSSLSFIHIRLHTHTTSTTSSTTTSTHIYHNSPHEASYTTPTLTLIESFLRLHDSDDCICSPP